jgi:osmotically-inducible protein OsmY
VRRVQVAFVFIFCGVTAAQQLHPSATAASSNTNVPIFAPAQTLGQQMNPLAAQPYEALTTPEVQRQIEQHFGSQGALANAKLEVKSDDHVVVLTGTVGEESQRDLAVHIAKLYSGNREL